VPSVCCTVRVTFVRVWQAVALASTAAQINVVIVFLMFLMFLMFLCGTINCIWLRQQAPW
jgi:hypothetical protein